MQSICTNCGEPLVPGGRFCEICGTPVENSAERDWDRPSLPPTSTSSAPDTTDATSPSSPVGAAPINGEDATAGDQLSSPVKPTGQRSTDQEVSSSSPALTTTHTPDSVEEASSLPGMRPEPEVWKSPYRDELYPEVSKDSDSYSPRISRRSALGTLGTISTVIAGGVLLCRLGALLTSHTNTSSRSTASYNPTPFPVTGTLYIYRGHTDIVWAAAWSPNGKNIASVSNDGTAQIWDATTGNKLLSNKAGFGPILSVAWSPNGASIASESFEEMDVWSASTGTQLYKNKGYSLAPHTVAWSPDGKRIACASDNHVVQVLEAASGNVLLTYIEHADDVMGVAWSPNGKHIASCSKDKTAKIWDAATGKTILTYTSHSDYVLTVAWSPDGKRIVSGSKDQTAQIWDAADGSTTATYTGHTDTVFAAEWSPDGHSIATGSADDSAHVWDASTAQSTFRYSGHTDHVTCLKWSPDGTKIVSSGYDKTAQIWQPQ